jgi:hypothetical protein
MEKEWSGVERNGRIFVNDVSGVKVQVLASVAGQRLSPLTGRACELQLPFTEGDRPLAQKTQDGGSPLLSRRQVQIVHLAMAH